MFELYLSEMHEETKFQNHNLKISFHLFNAKEICQIFQRFPALIDFIYANNTKYNFIKYAAKVIGIDRVVSFI